MASNAGTFGDLGLNEQIVQACERLNWITPTDIQAATIPPSLQGRNLIGLAETGSGKTAAYALPILQELMIAPKHYFSLILAPTRELASQVQAQFVALGKSIGLNTILLVGGSPIVEQANLMITKPPHILIATPGRFIDHLKRTKGFDEIKLQNLRFLVIDEADRMLGSDFESVIEKILIVLPPKRQTFLFSATMTEKVGKLQRASLRNPVRISTRKSKFQTVAGLKQYVQLVPQFQLETYLVYLLRSAFAPPTSATVIEGLDCIRLSHEEASKEESIELESREESIGSAIVFTRTRDTSNKLSLLLRQFLTVPVITLNGDMPQAQRLGALAKFKRVPMSVLVATDVASRGLDIPHVGLVVNYDVPLDAKTYMHRVGRTARAGRKGAALTLLTQFSVVFYLTEIEKHLLNTEGSTQEKVPALVAANSLADSALDTAVCELQHEVMTAMVLAGKTIAGFQRKSKGNGKAGNGFLSVDDHPTPSTSEIAVPIGTKRTGWGCEAPETLKRDIAAVLTATSVQSGVAEREEASLKASKQMSRFKKKKWQKGKERDGNSATSGSRQGFKRAYLRREANAREDKKGKNTVTPSTQRGGKFSSDYRSKRRSGSSKRRKF